MNSVALRCCVKFAYVFLAGFISFHSFAHNNNGSKSDNIVVNEESTLLSVTATAEILPAFAWSAERKLTWDDFKGPINTDEDDMTAAATYCGLGFESNSSGSLSVKVYNRFFPAKSWVKAGELKSSILAHEQTHFDICELYTRILRKRLTQAIEANGMDVSTLKDIYNTVQAEYAAFQELYEQETNHGMIGHAQQKWENTVSAKIDVTEI